MGRSRRDGAQRHGRRVGGAVAAVGAAGLLLTTACTSITERSSSAPSSTTSPPRPLLATPVRPVPPLWDQTNVDTAVGQLDSIVQGAMDTTGVPGIAVAVVYHDKVVYSKGFGVREVGKPDKIDPDTVFQVASVSKPVASTILAEQVGKKVFGWDDPVIKYNPGFALKDPFVTQNATFADLFSHRSGLYTGAGDLLEDLGWDRDYILSKLDQQPLDPFRSSYNYSNFGITEGGQAAADAAKTTWEDLADTTLFKPLGMSESSYRHAEYEARTDKALIHVEVGDPKDKKWEAKYVRNADAEAPAGGLSSSVKDMAQFIRLQLGNGKIDGTQVVDPDALAVTHVTHSIRSSPTDSAIRPAYYGLGWNVDTDDQGRVRINHSGAFALGTGTNVAIIPGEDIGIVTLTNGAPIGVPEAIDNAFFDVAQNGRVTVDWVSFYASQFRGLEAAELPPGATDYTKPPANPKAAQADSAYVGTYANSYYGPLTVTATNGALSMSMGPAGKQTTFPLAHYDGDTFTFQSIGENATGISGAVFTPGTGTGGTASSVKLGYYDTRGLGTFTRRT